MDKSKAKRLIITLISIFIIIYVVYLLIGSIFNLKGIETEVATEITATNSLYKDALIIRDESLIKNDTQGVISYTCDDGDKVGKNGVVADIYNSEEDVLNNHEYKSVNEEINRLKKLNVSVSNGDLNIDTLNSQIYNSISDLNKNVADRNFLSGDDYVDSLTYLVTERLMITGNSVNLSKRISELENEKQSLENQSGNKIGKIKSPEAGCFVSTADGYESVYKYKNAKNMDISGYNKLLKAKPKKVSSDTVGKIVKSVNWYVLCPLTQQEALTLSTSTYESIKVNMPYASSDTIPATIESVNKDPKGGDSVLVLKCNYMNSDIASIRKENIEICLNTYEGIRVNKDAIHDDVVTKISEDENGNQITDKKKVQGVFVLYGNELQFKEISIIYSGSDFVICDPSPEEGVLFNGETVSLYDNIVVKGSDLKDGKIVN